MSNFVTSYKYIDIDNADDEVIIDLLIDNTEAQFYDSRAFEIPQGINPKLCENFSRITSQNFH